jgi:8-oxo-dGTP pyrophosphatase MutT (NUDIX family)
VKVASPALTDALRATVGAIVPFDAAETDAQRSVLRWIDSGDALYRDSGSAPARHLAVYLTLLDPADDAVLQIHHVKAGAWIFPGGHVDTEEPCDAVVREAHEELGIAATFHPTTGCRPLLLTESQTNGLTDSHTDITLWYVLTGDRAVTLTPDPAEINAVRWVRLDEASTWAPQSPTPHQAYRFAAKLTAALRVPHRRESS